MIYQLRELKPDTLAEAGGKASVLARLIQGDYPVPDGFVILPGSFNGERLDDDAWELAQKELTVLWGSNGRFPVAVRSSALMEDSGHASFAGEFDSILNVTGETAVRRAIEVVYRSGNSDRVRAYSAVQGIEDAQQVAVIVQEMVPAELAGVLFTADPLTGSHQAMIGNFVTGLGEKLVAGEVAVQAFTLERPQGKYSGPPAMKKHARQLFKLADRMAEEMGSALDIEWAVAGKKLFILQARPITTMQGYDPRSGEFNDSLRGEYLWTNSNFGEALPEVMTPLTWSLIQIFAEETIPLFLPSYHPVIGNIGGRFYMNISLFASMMKTMGFSRQRMNYESEEFFGTLPPDLDIPYIPISRWQLLRRYLPQAIKLVRRRRAYLGRLAEFTAQAPFASDNLLQNIKAAQTPLQLANLWKNELDPFMRELSIMLQAGTSKYENLVRPMRRKLAEEVGETDANILLSGVSRDGDTLASLGPLLGLWRVTQGEISREEYTQRYGHRGPNEFELSLPAEAEDPDWLDTQLAQLKDSDVAAMLANQEEKRHAVLQNYEKRFPRKAEKLAKKLDQAAAAAREREAIRSEFTRFFSVVRQFALRAGALTGLQSAVFFLSLAELNDQLNETGVDFAEIIAARKEAHARFVELPPYPALIRGRFDPYAWAADPQRRTDLFATHLAEEGQVALPSETAVTGFAGSAGIVEGFVRRLDSPDEGAALQPGEILVTVTTNIGWTPLFPRTGAIVTDVGAPLSHAAIVARELGIPAVVGCGEATMRLQTGDYVRVNGGKGLVELLSNK